MHDVAHAPELTLHRNGEHCCDVPDESSDALRSGVHCWRSSGMQAPLAHQKPLAQLELASHVVAQVKVPSSQANGSQTATGGFTQAPWSSQIPARWATSSEVHAPAEHSAPTFANAAHAPTTKPSHAIAAQKSVPPSVQGLRVVPCGAPVIAVHVPRLVATSHAWHCPPHAWSQQWPSTQNPDAQTLESRHAAPRVASTGSAALGDAIDSAARAKSRLAIEVRIVWLAELSVA